MEISLKPLSRFRGPLLIADRRDTLALGAVLRGPLVGLTEEEIADEIQALQQVTNQARPLYIWTDSALIRHPVLKDTIERLQNLARKARRTTPYQLLAEAVEELQVRPILKARHPRGAERRSRILSSYWRWRVPMPPAVSWSGVVARIVTSPRDAHRQDPHLPMRYDTGRPRAVIRLRISQPRTTSLPCPAGLRARRPSPMMDL